MNSRQITLILLAVAISACGTPCTRIANAEAAANQKGKACNSTSSNWDSSHVQRCEAGLTSCSADDQKWLDTYADCLQKLPTCADGQALSWNLQRVSCSESLFKISGKCGSAIQ